MSWRDQPAYTRVFLTLVRNSLIRDMTFRSNFVIECLSSIAWVLMNLGFYLLIFQYTREIGRGSGWGKFEFFVFLSTTMFINSLVQTFFMPNAQEFSELIRSGNLDFALLKPIDTQFLVSLRQVDWSSLANFGVGLGLLGYSLLKLTTRAESPLVLHTSVWLLYPFYILCGVAIMYSLMISLAATSIWMGRNQTLYDFWFYITNFSRYPMEIYGGRFGDPLRFLFTFLIPVLVVVNVPARLLALPLRWHDPAAWWLPAFAVVATVVSLVASRFVFQRALQSYRSASS
jgi:ABC-2 type transport system permease protein